ncbi:MAG: transglutaminase-like domain-containing protein [Acidimicrobiales bacterium]|nr:transglutaminase-like domain-containing protein [Acidimicrobiales bacterium]
MIPSRDALDFYASPGPMTDLTPHAGALRDAPTDPAGIASMVQGLLVHPHWAAAYDVLDVTERQAELQARGATALLTGVLTRDDRPLTEARTPQGRFLGNCRDFSTLSVALLRRAGTPARARCGFGGYFEPGKWVDHWIVEHWDGVRWVQLDAQLDALQSEVTGVADPTDLPEDHFLSAGDAWQRTRAGELDPDTFGILDMWGAWFIAGNVGRDLASLNKIEMLPWDDWGALAGDENTAAPDTLVDEISALLLTEDTAAIRSRYESTARLRVGPEVMSLTETGEWGPSTVLELA